MNKIEKEIDGYGEEKEEGKQDQRSLPWPGDLWFWSWLVLISLGLGWSWLVLVGLG